MLAANVLEKLEVIARRNNESAFAENGFGNHSSDGFRRDRTLEGIFEMMRKILRCRAGCIAVRIGERDAVDVACERLETRFVRMCLAGQRHGEQSAAMESIFEANNGGTFCIGASDFDGIFDGLCAGIYKNGFLRKIAGGQRVQFFSDGDVAFVRGNRKTQVQIFFKLFADRGNDARRAMADIEAADSSRKIDITVAIDVFDGSAIRTRCENGRGVGGPAGDGGLAAGHESARPRPGNFRSNLNRSHFLFPFAPPRERPA